MVEQRTENPCVPGSIPGGTTKRILSSIAIGDFFLVFMKYYTYILENSLNQQFYIGQTEDIPSRLKRHNSGRANFTKGKGNWHLIHFTQLSSRSEAMKLEKQLKGLKSRNLIMDFMDNNKIDSCADTTQIFDLLVVRASTKN